MIDLLILACIIVFIVDLSGVVDHIEKWLSRKKKTVVRIGKPWGCSLCMTWWSGLIYLIINGMLTIPWIGVVGALSFLTPVIGDILLAIREILTRLTWLWDRGKR